MYKLVFITLFIAAASASSPLAHLPVAHAPLAVAHAPLAVAHAPVATSYAHSYRVAHSVHAPVVRPVYPAAPAYHALAPAAPAYHALAPAAPHAPLVAPAHAPLSYGYAAPYAYARHGWAL